MDIEAVKEYRKDGSLRYECTKRFLSKEEEHLFDNRILTKGKSFIRINHATKYREDGSIEWRLIYNDEGYVIESKKKIINHERTKTTNKRAN